MKLWLLKAHPDNERWGYDCYYGFVVRAVDEKAAREMVPVGDEGAGWRNFGNPWLDELLTSCVELTVHGKPEVVLSDFSAG